MHRKNKSFAKLTFTVACLLSASPAVAQEYESGGVPSREEITAVTAARNAALKSLFVEYKMRGKLLGSAEDAKRYLDLVALIDETKAFAFSGAMRYTALNRPDDHYVDIAPSVSVGDSAEPAAKIPQPTTEFNKVLE